MGVLCDYVGISPATRKRKLSNMCARKKIRTKSVCAPERERRGEREEREKRETERDWERWRGGERERLYEREKEKERIQTTNASGKRKMREREER